MSQRVPRQMNSNHAYEYCSMRDVGYIWSGIIRTRRRGFAAIIYRYLSFAEGEGWRESSMQQMHRIHQKAPLAFPKPGWLWLNYYIE